MVKAEHPGILVITWNFPPKLGGMENLIAGLCKELRKNYPLFVITSHADSDEAREDWIFRPRWPGLLAFSLYALSRGAILLRRNPDVRVIIGGSAMVTPIVLILARLFSRRAVINVHGLDLIYPSPLYQALCVRWIRHCDRVIANSRYTATLVERRMVRRDSVCVIPPGVNWEFFGSFHPGDLRKDLGLEGRKVVLHVGRLARRKGVKEFIENSLVRIVAEVPEAILVIVGSNPTASLVHQEDVMRNLKNLLRERQMEDYVRLLGWVSGADLVKIYQLSDLLVLPVLSLKNDIEGFGITILEAAAAGKPAVATRVGGIPDAIENGKSGVLVDPRDYNTMSRTVAELLLNDELRLTLGKYAQRRVREKFSWDVIIRKYEEALDSLTAGNSR